MDRSLIIDILVRKVAGEALPAEEDRLLEDWCRLSLANQAIYDRIMSGENLHDWMSTSDGHRMILAVQGKLRLRRRKRLVSVLSAAAVVIIGILLIPGKREASPVAPNGVATLTLADGREITLTGDETGETWQKYMNHIPDDAGDPGPLCLYKIAVARGQKYELTLADGSRVWLNEETVLEYPGRFQGPVREVSMAGEAFFEIAADSAARFVVNTTDRLRVVVTGTRFNVNSYEDQSEVKVTLMEGMVSVCDGKSEIGLTPNQQLVFDRHNAGISVEYVDAAAQMEWIYGMFGFDSVPLNDVVEEISRWYGIDIFYDRHSDPEIGAVTFHSVRYTDHKRVLEMLSDMTGRKFTVRDEK